MAGETAQEAIQVGGKVAQLPGQVACLEAGVQLHPKVLLAGLVGAGDGAVVAEEEHGLGGEIVGGGGEVGVDEGEVAIRRREGHAVLELLQVGFQSGYEKLVGRLTAALLFEELLHLPHKPRRALGVEVGEGLGHGQEDGLR